MKFAKQLKLYSHPPWIDKYLDYHYLKRMIKRYQNGRMARAGKDRIREHSYAREQAELAAKDETLGVISEKTPLTELSPGHAIESSWGACAVTNGIRATARNELENGWQAESKREPGPTVDEGRNGRRLHHSQSRYPSDSSEETGMMSGQMSPRMAQATVEYEEYRRNRRDESEVVGRDAEEEFFPKLERELHKVEAFNAWKYAHLKGQVDSFAIRLELIHSGGAMWTDLISEMHGPYTEIIALAKYCEINSEGFRKIVKKFDKVMGTNILHSSFLARLQKFGFYESKGPKELLARVQGLLPRDKMLEMEIRLETERTSPVDSAIFPAVSFLWVGFSCLLFLVTWQLKPDFDGNVHAARCLRLLVLVTSLWVTEAIPYFVTAILIPVLVVLLGVMADTDGNDMEKPRAAQYVLSHMVNHTTMLILGGYSISAAFSRCEIELRIAALLQQRLGNRPRLFILGIMYLGLLLSMFISNHTAPVLCVSILTPVIQDFKTDSRFAKTLLLGLAFACNFGGMLTPISSMQNVVAQQTLEDAGMSIGFGTWIAVALPFCILGVLVAWCLLCSIVGPEDVAIPSIVYSQKGNVFSGKNVFIISISLATVVGWSTIGFTQEYWGDIGILSLAFLVVAFGSGILTEVDFNSFSWHTLFLLGGGNVIGKAIRSSQLLDILARAIVEMLPKENPFMLLLAVVSITMIISTFVSHTVSALILMPIIVEVGIGCDNPVLLGMGAALAFSSGCALPFSSFPNVTSLLVTNDHGHKYLEVKDFVMSGVPMSVAAVLLICTLGYGLIDWLLVPTVVLSGDDDKNMGHFAL